MIIGVDLDGTYAADVSTFRKVVDVFQQAGHRCVLVTNRGPDDRALVESIVLGQMPLIFAAGSPKKVAALAAGYAVDVWIDDNPILVDFGGMGLVMVGGADR